MGLDGVGAVAKENNQPGHDSEMFFRNLCHRCTCISPFASPIDEDPEDHGQKPGGNVELADVEYRGPLFLTVRWFVVLGGWNDVVEVPLRDRQPRKCDQQSGKQQSVNISEPLFARSFVLTND